MHKTLAIVVTYNRAAMLAKCLEALKTQVVSTDILVVDNASSDETQSFMQQNVSSSLFYVRLNANIGGAGGFNFGMRWALEHNYERLWIMDDDCIPQKDALLELEKAENLLGENFGFLCSTVLWTNGKECRMNRQAVYKRFFEHIELLGDGILAVQQATFVSCYFKAETVCQFGLPIKEFFIWGDDIEYTRRLAVRNKLPCFLVGKSKVVHCMATNNGSDIVTESKERLGRFSYAYRNENYLYRQEGIKGFLYYLARCGYHLFRIWTKAKDNRWKRSLVLLRAFFSGFWFLPKKEY